MDLRQAPRTPSRRCAAVGSMSAGTVIAQIQGFCPPAGRRRDRDRLTAAGTLGINQSGPFPVLAVTAGGLTTSQQPHSFVARGMAPRAARRASPGSGSPPGRLARSSRASRRFVCGRSSLVTQPSRWRSVSIGRSGCPGAAAGPLSGSGSGAGGVAPGGPRARDDSVGLRQLQRGLDARDHAVDDGDCPPPAGSRQGPALLKGLTRPIRLILVFVLVRRRRMHMRPCRPLPPGQLAYLARELFARHTGVRWPESPVIPGWGDHP